MVACLLSCLVLHSVAPKWSDPVAGLQSYIDVERHGEKGGSPKLVTYLNLRNVTDSFGTVDIYLSMGNVVLWLEDESGHKLKDNPAGVNGRNGFVPNPFWLQLPIDSTIRMRVDLSGYFPPPPCELLIEGESALLAVPKGWGKPVFLAGKFVVKDPPHEARGNRWEGTMVFPRILIFNGKRIVAAGRQGGERS